MQKSTGFPIFSFDSAMEDFDRLKSDVRSLQQKHETRSCKQRREGEKVTTQNITPSPHPGSIKEEVGWSKTPSRASSSVLPLVA